MKLFSNLNYYVIIVAFLSKAIMLQQIIDCFVNNDHALKFWL